jgi:uncharacterized protein YjbI with pentapeptide repeats
MAHPEHLAVLQHGVARWNAWRVEHPMVRPDLADLDADRDLRALFTSDDPFDLYLDGINLADALLDAARFEQVSFAGADLANAHLGGAVIRYCSFKNATLQGADLSRVELTGTTLNGCRMGRATCGDTRLHRLDLSQAEGLADVGHRFASIVDVDTLVRTGVARDRGADLTEVRAFLAAAGVPASYLTLALGAA